jgi:hypothetical protein
MTIHNKPRMYQYRLAILNPSKEPDLVRYINALVDDDCGDILVYGFWASRTDCIITADMKLNAKH